MTTTQPLDFDPFSADYFDHPYETYARLRDEAPVYYSEKYNFYALSRHEDVEAGIRDFDTFSSTKGIDLQMVQSGEPPPPMVIMMDPPEHKRMRQLVNRVFTPRAISALEPMVREQIAHFLAQVNPAGFDVVHDFSALFPVDLISRMLGVPEESRQQIRLWLDTMLTRQYGSIETSPEGVEAGMATGLLYYELIQERRANPQDDMISKLIEAEIVREDGDGPTRLDDIEIAGFASLLGGAGAETVTKLIGNAIVTFSENPSAWQALLEDRSKIPAAVEELLRYQAPASYLVRYSLRESTHHGVTIPAGQAVLLLVGSANRDSRAFTDADRFDIDRDREQAQNIGLGYGIHSCLGAALARMESRIAIEMLLDFMPRYQVDRSGLKRVAMTNVNGWANVPVTVQR